jgi:hypothetical protein
MRTAKTTNPDSREAFPTLRGKDLAVTGDVAGWTGTDSRSGKTLVEKNGVGRDLCGSWTITYGAKG